MTGGLVRPIRVLLKVMERFEPTAEQEQVIRHRGSHALVFAGPGTGKTETLARRFASLVADDSLDPSAILVLTFSRRAADQMLERIVQRLEERRHAGLAVSELFVNTFHSFCARLLDGDGPRFRERNLLTPVKERLLFKRVAARVPLESFDPAVRSSPAFAADALNLIAQLKGQGMTPADVEATAGSDARLRDIAALYRALDVDRTRLALSDFRDLVADAVAALGLVESPGSRWLRDRGGFRHILVDEFQDSDKLQLRILEILAGPERMRERPDPEICFVGDFNQSIYRFRGATPENIETVRKTFACIELTLHTNRRSAQAILDVANATPQLEPESLTQAEDASKPGSIALLRAADPDAEVALVCDEIAARIEAGTPARAIAVLLRVTEPYQSAIVAGLDVRGVPVAARPTAGFLADPLIGATLTALRLLAFEGTASDQTEREQDLERALWTRLLTNPVIGFRAVSVRMAFDAARRDHVSNVMAALRRYPPDGVRPFAEIASAWQRVLRETKGADAASALSTIARELDLLGPVRDARAPAGFDLHGSPARLGALAEAARDMCATERALSGRRVEPAQLVDDIGELAGLLADPAEAPPAEADGVRVMSIHAAKGLEFDCVIVPQAIDGVLPQRQRGHALLSNASVRALHARGAALFAESSEAYREECSLWYVALTRARREGLVTAPLADRDDIEQPLSLFARGIRVDSTGAKAPALQTPARTSAVQAPVLQPRRAIRHAVDHLSPSTVDEFLKCPRRFFYHNVLRLTPDHDEESTLLGSMLHQVLKAFHEQYRDFSTPGDIEALRATWRAALREALDEEAPKAAAQNNLQLESSFFRYLRAQADHHLDNYANRLACEARDAPFAVLASEQRLTGDIGGVAFTGRADRIDRLQSGGLAIRDYKSGRLYALCANAVRQALDRLEAGETLAGDAPAGLNLQLLMYMPAVETLYGERVAKLEYIYFGGKDREDEDLFVDDIAVLDDPDSVAGRRPEKFLMRSDIERAQRDIAAAVARTCAEGSLEAFATALSQETCKFCGFVRACTGAGTVAS
jgi:DNA helicase II / ATP-dependent DNA helicase PcrA